MNNAYGVFALSVFRPFLMGKAISRDVDLVACAERVRNATWRLRANVTFASAALSIVTVQKKTVS